MLNVDFYPDFLNKEEASNLFNILEEKVVWCRKTYENQRTSQTYGDDGLIYEINWYNKKTYRKVHPWNEVNVLSYVRDRVQNITGEKYNICVVQRYPHGNIGINPHRDKEMKKGTTICGISIGETRCLSIDGKYNIELELTPGSMYLIHQQTNIIHIVLKKIIPRM